MDSMNEQFDWDILFVGGVFQKDEENEIIENSKIFIQSAANTFQWKFINGIDEFNKNPIKILNAVFIGNYPKYYKKLFIRSRKWSHVNFSSDQSIGFINAFGVKEILRRKLLKKAIVKWSRISSKKKKVIFVYSLNTAFLSSAVCAKEIDKNIKICLICPDLPEYMNRPGSRGRMFDFLKKIDQKSQNKYLRKIDYFVFISKYMNERINKDDKPWCVVEGISDYSTTIEEKFLNGLNIDIEKSKYVILYTGTMIERYGVIDLIKEFCNINDSNLELWLCGSGLDETVINSYVKNDSRIKYFGHVSRDEVLIMQKNVSLLVNPRKADGEYVKFSFPSKIIEYFESGTPILMRKLPGIPDEYYKYVYLIDDYENSIELAIKSVLKMDDDYLHDRAFKAKQFIINEKSKKVQIKKILEMIDSSV